MAATPFNVNSFKTKLTGGGARPALFKVELFAATGGSLFATNDHLLIKAASLPASNIAPLPINYAGRAYKMQGFRTFDPWVVTIINDENFSIRNKITAWMVRLAGGFDGKRSKTSQSFPGFTTTSKQGEWDADSTAIVTQLSQSGEAGKKYKFHGLWPTELAPIPLDWSSDMIEEYSVTFAYDYWTTGTNNGASNQIGTDIPTPKVKSSVSAS